MLPSDSMARSRKRFRAKLDAPEPIDTLLERAGEDRFAKSRPPISVRDWRAAMGARIADRTRPLALERGVLVVRVATSAWANELQMLAPELVARLRLRGFAVDNLRFRVGPLEILERPPERRVSRKVPPPVPLAPELAQKVQQIEDPELRDIVGAAARANLAWQSYLGAELPKGTPAMPARAPTDAPTAAPPSARGPRGAGTGTAPPGRTGGGSGGASRRSYGGDSGRRR